MTTLTIENNPEFNNAIRCPKNMKLPTAVKAVGAMMRGTKAERNSFMRSMGIALHEQALKMKTAAKESNRSTKPVGGIPSSGPATE